MSFTQQERYRSVSEFADDIENYLKGEALIAGPPSAVYRLKKFVQRNRMLIIGVVAVLAVLVTGAVVSTIFAIRAERQAKIAQAVNDFFNRHVLSSISSASWFAIRIRPQLTLHFVISHTRDAISMGVLFAGLLDCC